MSDHKQKRRLGPVAATVTVVVILALPYLIPKAWSLLHPEDAPPPASTVEPEPTP